MKLLTILNLTLYLRPAFMVGLQWGTKMGFGIAVGPLVLFISKDSGDNR